MDISRAGVPLGIPGTSGWEEHSRGKEAGTCRHVVWSNRQCRPIQQRRDFVPVVTVSIMEIEFDVIAEGLFFPEGPLVLPDGSVVVVEVGGGVLTRIDPTDGSKQTVARPGGGPNGAAVGPDGALYVCNNGGLAFKDGTDGHFPSGQAADYSGGRIERIDLDSGTTEVIFRESNGHPLKGPNDIVFDASGGFWFTDHPKKRDRDRDWGGVHYVAADYASITEVRHKLDDPNGIGLSPDGSTLYVADTRAARLWSWPVLAPGVLAGDESTFMGVRGRGATCIATLPRFQSFDSLAVEAGGHVVVATIAEPAGLTVVDPVTGGYVLTELPDPIPTNVCFGGDDMQTAYATLSSRGLLVRMRWPRPGLRLNFQ